MSYTKLAWRNEPPEFGIHNDTYWWLECTGYYGRVFTGIVRVVATPRSGRKLKMFRAFSNSSGDDVPTGKKEGWYWAGPINMPERYEDSTPQKKVVLSSFNMEKSDSMSFGEALEALKRGAFVARNGWNRKGAWLWLVQKDEYRLTAPLSPQNIPVAESMTEATMLPWIMMCTAQGDFVPWLASQTDMLAEDWEIFE